MPEVVTNTPDAGVLRTAGVGEVEALLAAIVETDRQIAAAQARRAALLAGAVDLARAQEAAAGGPASAADIPVRSLAAQIGAVLRVPDRTVQRHMSDAVVLVDAFPATLAAWAGGEISRGHVHVIVEAGLPIDDPATRSLFEHAALEIACRETPGRARPAVRVLSHRLHPIPLTQRHRAAAAARDVRVRDLDDGMAELTATLPAAYAHGIRDRLDRLARTIVDARPGAPANRDRPGGDGDAARSCADTRRIGQVRADVFTDLLLTGHSSPEVTGASTPETDAILARVQITVPVLTVLGADTTPAELTGHTPIDTATALRLAGTATGWDRILTHPITGTVLAVDRYRPTGPLRRALRARDEHCRFPGCRTPTRHCDIDHTTPAHHGGPTRIDNLAHLCRRHHTLKHHSAWRVTHTPDGVLHWTSPTGRTHPDRPARTLRFETNSPDTDQPDPPPF